MAPVESPAAGSESCIADPTAKVGLPRHVRFKPAGWALQRARSNSDYRLAYPELARGILAREDELVEQVLDSDVSGF